MEREVHRASVENLSLPPSCAAVGSSRRKESWACLAPTPRSGTGQEEVIPGEIHPEAAGGRKP